MRSLDEALSAFVYHPATQDTAPKHAAVRDLFVETVGKLWDLVPDGPEKTLALRQLQVAAMYANAGIAMTAPADTSAARGVARVLPPGCRCAELGPDKRDHADGLCLPRFITGG